MAVTYFDNPLMVAYSPLATGGPYSISGSTRNTGTPTVPVRRRVRLHQQITGVAVREVWSAESNGAYLFERLTAGVYYVAAFDHTGTYGAEVESDIVLPEPAP